MPKKAMTHIQNTAPGPPIRMAPATPTMLPVPTVAARAVHRDWNWEMLLSAVWPMTPRSFMAPRVRFIQWRKWVTWNTRVRTVISMPTKASSRMAGQPHTTPLTASLIRVSVSQNPFAAAASSAAKTARRGAIHSSRASNSSVDRFMVPSFPSQGCDAPFPRRVPPSGK